MPTYRHCDLCDERIGNGDPIYSAEINVDEYANRVNGWDGGRVNIGSSDRPDWRNAKQNPDIVCLMCLTKILRTLLECKEGASK